MIPFKRRILIPEGEGTSPDPSKEILWMTRLLQKQRHAQLGIFSLLPAFQLISFKSLVAPDQFYILVQVDDFKSLVAAE